MSAFINLKWRRKKSPPPSGRVIKILIVLLIIACPLFYLLRWSIPGISFLFALASIACLMAVFFLLSLLPWQKRGLRLAGRVLRLLYLAGAIAFIISFAVIQSAVWQKAAQARQQSPTASCLLVLGAGLRGDIPSVMLQNRLTAALDYMRANPESQAVLAGGQGPGESITEALAMRRWLMNNGIGGERLHMERFSTSTGENLAFSKPIIVGLGYDTVVIVSNDFHLLRISWLAAHYGLNAQLLGAPTPRFFFIPSASYFREYFALIKDWLLLNLYPQALPQSG